MNTRTRNTDNTAKETSFAKRSRSGTDAESLFPDLPGAAGRPPEDEAIVALFAEAGLAVEVVATCGDASCPECFATREAGPAHDFGRNRIAA